MIKQEMNDSSPVVNPSSAFNLSLPIVDLIPSVDPAALFLFNGQNKHVVDKLLAFLTVEARESLIPIRQHRILLDVDSDTSKKRLLVRQYIAVNADSGMSYWDQLVVPVDQWIASLPECEAQIVTEDIVIDVQWDT